MSRHVRPRLSRVQVAHAVRGRLRIRYPTRWLKARRTTIESTVGGIPGVRSVVGSPVTGSLRIDYDPFRVAETALLASLEALHAELEVPTESGVTASAPRIADRQAPVINLLGATSALTATFLPLSTPMIAGFVLAAGLPSIVRAGHALAVRRRVNGDVLEASTFLLLALRGHYRAGALLTWLRAAGEFVVARSVVTTRRSLRDVVAASDQTVPRLTDGRRWPVRAVSLHVGDIIVVGSGRHIPADGTVVSGEALVNQQTMTGEALPVERRPGDSVFAATIVEHGEIEIRVDRVGLDTAVGRIVRTIETAADEKTNIQVFAERLADREVKRTLALAGLGTVFARSLDAGTAILVADYGTAARVGIPTAVIASVKRASRQGILIKGPRVLEALARVDTVVFDKTGTLTSGAPRVTRVVSYDRALRENDVVRMVAAAEHGFRHPVARAIARFAAERQIPEPGEAVRVERPGLGVEVRLDGRRILVGSRRFLEAQGVDLDAARRDEHAVHAIGASPTFLAVDDRLSGLLAFQDQLRPDAAAAVQELRARNMRNVIMLSGDHAEPSRVIAQSLGLRHHYAELLPEDKARLIRQLKAEGRVVAMVGDGVNDALALREADVGIAVPGGAVVAAEAADVVLLRGGLDQVVRALDLARQSMDDVRHTLGIAARANLAVVGLASFGWARPLASILISHGATVAAALFTATASRARGSVQPAVSS